MPEIEGRAGDILNLLQSCAQVTQMRLCYHDYLLRLDLPYEYTVHESAYCLRIKEVNRKSCAAFCGAGGEVDQHIADQPGGWLHLCPFGCLKIAAGVFHDGILAGVLFAQDLREPAEIPPPGKVSPAPAGSGEWAEDRLRIVHAVAGEIGRLLRPDSVRPGRTRRARIMRYIEQHLAENPRLEGLGQELNLSASRAGHLVEEIFGESFTALVRQVRCNRAALLLTASPYPVSEIALRLGFSDQSHLIRTFKKQTGLTPLAYRKKSSSRAHD